MKKEFKTFCPLFPGFYGTAFEYQNESEDINYYNEENGTNLDYDAFNWDYADYSNRVCKAFVNRLENELSYILPIKITFEEIVSPKEYNFRNDSINVIVEVDLTELMAKVNGAKEQAAIYFKDRYTSCSGFISFHSPDIEDWLTEEYILSEPEHRIGALLDCLCHIELDTEDIIYWADDQYYIDYWPKENEPA